VACLTTVEASLPNGSARGTSLHLRTSWQVLSVLWEVGKLAHLIGALLLTLNLVGALKLILPLLHSRTLLRPLGHGQARADVAARLPDAVELPLPLI
jgi:hypothetical protein